MTKAVFLDRDGTINREVGNLRRIRDLRILPGVARAIKQLNDLGFLTIVITNQPVVSRGWVTEREVDEIHAVIARRIGKHGAKLDAVYFCPHHPDAQVKKYKLHCACRKPNVGMIKDAMKKFKIDMRKSFMIGDTTRDILTGKRAKLTTILVKTGYKGMDGKYNMKPDFVAKNLTDAVKIIKEQTD